MKMDKEKIKKELMKGDYVRLEIIVPNVEKNVSGVTPCMELDIKANSVTLMLLCKTLDDVKKEIVKKHPEIMLAEMLVGFENKGKIYKEEKSHE